MKRRDFIKNIALGASVAGVSNFVPAGQAEETNCIIIYVDDRVTEAIQKGALVPHIDKMAAEGLYFPNAYSTAPCCTPARYSTLTGRYAGRCQGRFLHSGITKEGQTWVHWNASTDSDDTMAATVMQNAGYATGIVGKLGCFLIREAGNTNRFNEGAPDDPDKIRRFWEHQRLLKKGVHKFGFDYGGALTSGNMGGNQRHNPEYQTKCCLDFIDKNRDKPFYLHFVPHLMHGPRPIKSLKDDPRNLYGILLEEAPKVQPSRESVLRRVKEAGLEEDLAGATWLDDSIGVILDRLRELNLKNNTLVMMMQDNAHHGGKGSCFEGGANVLGCWMTWPNGIVNPGRINRSMVTNMDFVPTMFAASGVQPPGDYQIDGQNLMPILKDQKESVRDSVLIEMGHTRAVIKDNWKYLALRVPPSHELSPERKAKYIELAKSDPTMDPKGRVTHIHRQLGGCNTERSQALKTKANYFDRDQLYNLAKDPEEQNNLAKNPEYAAKLSEFKRLLRKRILNAPGTFADFKGYADMSPEDELKFREAARQNRWDEAPVNTKALRKLKKRKK